MGERGPISRFESDNSTTIDMNGTVEIPRQDANWHPYAQQWYRALQNSGQSRLFEPSDWMQAFILADVLSRMLWKGGYSAELFKGWLSGITSLGVTIGDRRRMQVEVKRLAYQDALPEVEDPYDEYARMIEPAGGTPDEPPAGPARP